jgi:hypothetical protein
VANVPAAHINDGQDSGNEKRDSTQGKEIPINGLDKLDNPHNF